MSRSTYHVVGTAFSLSWRCKGSEHRLLDCNYASDTAQYYSGNGIEIQCQPGKQIMDLLIILLISTTLHKNYDAITVFTLINREKLNKYIFGILRIIFLF